MRKRKKSSGKVRRHESSNPRFFDVSNFRRIDILIAATADKALEKSKNHRFCTILSALCRIFISLTVVDRFSVFVVVEAGRVGNKKTVTNLSQARHRKVDILDN